MQEWLQGKKTYFIVGLGALTVLVNFLAGDITFMEFLQSDKMTLLFEILGLGTLYAKLSRMGKGGK